MKTRKLKGIKREAYNFGPVQLWVSPSGRLHTFGNDDPRFESFKGQAVVLLSADNYQKLLMQLWEQKHLIQCA